MINLSFILTSLAVVLIPGTGVLYTVSMGLSRGRKASLWAALGCTLGIVPHLLAAALGLSAIMQMSAVAFSALKFMGAFYLFYLAYMTWMDKSKIDIKADSDTCDRKSYIRRGVLLNLLNPKLTLFFFAFLPQFILPTQGHEITQLLLLSSIFMLMTFGIFVLYGFLADLFRVKVVGRPTIQRWLKRSFATVFALLGIKLALSAE